MQVDGPFAPHDLEQCERVKVAFVLQPCSMLLHLGIP